MGEAKFTPGPWRFGKGNIGNLIEGPSGKTAYEGDDGFRGVACVQSCGSFDKHDEDEANRLANMALISAAPDLYEALKTFADHFGPLDDNPMLHPDARKCYALARSALAKARGET
jgi:dienelactone hydrolase